MSENNARKWRRKKAHFQSFVVSGVTEKNKETYKNIVSNTISEYFIIIFFYILYLRTIKHKFDFNFIIFCMKKHSLRIIKVLI